jgi:antirestriction protein
MLSEVPQSLRDYFDFERFASDLFSSDRFSSNGHVFYSC